MYEPPEDTNARRKAEASDQQLALMKAALVRPAAGHDTSVTNIRDWFTKRSKSISPPNDPPPRSPSRQRLPMTKIETNATSKEATIGDLLKRTLAARAHDVLRKHRGTTDCACRGNRPIGNSTCRCQPMLRFERA